MKIGDDLPAPWQAGLTASMVRGPHHPEEDRGIGAVGHLTHGKAISWEYSDLCLRSFFGSGLNDPDVKESG